MKTNTRSLRKDSGAMGYGAPLAVMALMMCGVMLITSYTAQVGYAADKFTDIFYTNSFRGAFEWFKKLDWVGMVVQCVISVFSLFGVALLVIRIMTSMLYLSAKGMWEEVHDLKSGGGESELYDFGMVNMAKSWAKGKAGTGLDAIIGAVLILLPDVKKYSDFGEKSGDKFSDDMTISQYMLKIALPTVMTVFFFAMGFNGTLFQALAVTVDAMGTAADKAVSVNYAGFVDDIVNTGGFKFSFSSEGTNLGDFKQDLAKDIYGRVLSEVRGAEPAQLYNIGTTVENKVKDWLSSPSGLVSENVSVSDKVKSGLQGGDHADSYVSYMGYEIVVGTKNDKAWKSIAISELVGSNMTSIGADSNKTINIFVKQTTDFNGMYLNTDREK